MAYDRNKVFNEVLSKVELFCKALQHQPVEPELQFKLFELEEEVRLHQKVDEVKPLKDLMFKGVIKTYCSSLIRLYNRATHTGHELPSIEELWNL